ncbi:MAG: hypothetical protein N2321_00955 [Melioribacteraceae bacterium]|nr:hypothetical protein [Melioribacteraceae bacterium]
MHEMLGNQYFMVRNFNSAVDEFEIAMVEQPNNFKIKKKLVVSYTQIGKPQKALELFLIISQKDINIIFNTDLVKDDCPCPELIPLIESKEKLNENSFDFYITLAILWAFCDKYRSLEYFNKAKLISPNNKILNEIINSFNDHFNSIEFAH